MGEDQSAIPNRPTPEPAAADAFTLVEMLVVMAIIGILASLVLSAVSKSKSKAMQTQCLGQNKQIALALQLYSQDARDVMPYPNWGTNFQGWLYTPFNGYPPMPTTPPEVAYEGGTLWPYLHVVKVYWCPMDSTNTQYFPERLEQLSSYIMNGAIMGYYRKPPAAKAHRLSSMNPIAYATWEPSDQPPYDPAFVFNDGASYPNNQEGPSQRHNTGCNVCSFDGHAQFLKYDIFQQQQNDLPGLLWCDPDTPQGNGGNMGRACKLW